VPSLNRPSWSFFSEEFHCPECGAEEAYQSRPRGSFERYVLPLFFLQPVRCGHCYLRSYVPRAVAAGVRPRPPYKQPGSQGSHSENSDSRVA
jgi:hypothetical protein